MGRKSSETESEKERERAQRQVGNRESRTGSKNTARIGIGENSIHGRGAQSVLSATRTLSVGEAACNDTSTAAIRCLGLSRSRSRSRNGDYANSSPVFGPRVVSLESVGRRVKFHVTLRNLDRGRSLSTVGDLDAATNRAAETRWFVPSDATPRNATAFYLWAAWLAERLMRWEWRAVRPWIREHLSGASGISASCMFPLLFSIDTDRGSISNAERCRCCCSGQHGTRHLRPKGQDRSLKLSSRYRVTR